ARYPARPPLSDVLLYQACRSGRGGRKGSSYVLAGWTRRPRVYRYAYLRGQRENDRRVPLPPSAATTFLLSRSVRAIERGLSPAHIPPKRDSVYQFCSVPRRPDSHREQRWACSAAPAGAADSRPAAVPPGQSRRENSSAHPAKARRRRTSVLLSEEQ